MDLILVVCGAGASSTFLASRMRSLADQRGLQITARAASNFDVESRLPEARVLLVGPHLASTFPELEAVAAAHSVRAALRSRCGNRPRLPSFRKQRRQKREDHYERRKRDPHADERAQLPKTRKPAEI